MQKIIGILWGMWPEASAHIYQQILTYCQEHYNSIQDNEYPRIILNSLALEGFDETWVCNESLVTGQLVQWVQMLQNAYCDYIIMACNTVHVYYDLLQSSIYTPIIHVIEETKNVITRNHHKKVGLISSKTTRDMRLYQDALENDNIECIQLWDQDQIKVNTTIERVMWGLQNQDDEQLIHELMKQFKQSGATACILGCTELPLVLTKKEPPLTQYNANNVIVEAVVKKCFE